MTPVNRRLMDSSSHKNLVHHMTYLGPAHGCMRLLPRSSVKALGRHVQYSVMRLGAGVQTSAAGAFAYQRIISNNSYTHDEQGHNPGQEK